VWRDTRSWDEIRRFEGHGGEYGVWCLAWRPDGRLLASGDSAGTIRIWDVHSCASLKRFDAPPTGEEEPYVSRPAWFPGRCLHRRELFFGDLFRLWDTRSLLEDRSLPTVHGESPGRGPGAGGGGPGAGLVRGGGGRAGSARSPGLFVQYPGHEVRPPIASRCERSESVPSGSMARLSEVLGGFWDNGTF
jgi:hypothetical protein